MIVVPFRVRSFDFTVFEITPQGSVHFIYQFDSAYGSVLRLPSGLIQASDGNFYGYATVAPGGIPPVIFQLTPTGVLSLMYTLQDGGFTPEPAAASQRTGIFTARCWVAVTARDICLGWHWAYPCRSRMSAISHRYPESRVEWWLAKEGTWWEQRW